MYRAFVKEQLKSFVFQSPILRTLLIYSFFDPIQAQQLPLSIFDLIEDFLAIPFDKQQTKLEHRDFATDSNVAPINDENAVDYWCRILQMYSFTHGRTMLQKILPH